jgi:menaquinone-specific isochorismate synthase
MESLRSVEASVEDTTVDVATRGCPVDQAAVSRLLSSRIRPSMTFDGPEETLVTCGAAATITASGPGRFDGVRRVATELLADRDVDPALPSLARPRLLGGFSFHDRGSSTLWQEFTDALFLLPAVTVVQRDGETWLTATAVGDDAGVSADRRLEEWCERLASHTAIESTNRPGVTARASTPSREGWQSQVEAAIDDVQSGSLRKVVLAQALTVSLGGGLSLPATLERLGDRYPDCYTFLAEPPGGGHFFGATPERLVSVRDTQVRTEALAGSTGRGETRDEEAWLEAQLRNSEKDVHEHELVVDAIRDQLSSYASAVRTGNRGVRKLATVQHLQTPLSAQLDREEHVLDLVEALHPTPAVGGQPPDLALETIRESETFDRGWYAAPVGWFDADGDGTFAVAIRSALARDHEATLFAGAGIVADSDPDREYDEVQLKYRPILDALE